MLENEEKKQSIRPIFRVAHIHTQRRIALQMNYFVRFGSDSNDLHLRRTNRHTSAMPHFGHLELEASRFLQGTIVYTIQKLLTNHYQIHNDLAKLFHVINR